MSDAPLDKLLTEDADAFARLDELVFDVHGHDMRAAPDAPPSVERGCGARAVLERILRGDGWAMWQDRTGYDVGNTLLCPQGPEADQDAFYCAYLLLNMRYPLCIARYAPLGKGAAATPEAHARPLLEPVAAAWGRVHERLAHLDREGLWEWVPPGAAGRAPVAVLPAADLRHLRAAYGLTDAPRAAPRTRRCGGTSSVRTPPSARRRGATATGSRTATPRPPPSNASAPPPACARCRTSSGRAPCTPPPPPRRGVDLVSAEFRTVRGVDLVDLVAGARPTRDAPPHPAPLPDPHPARALWLTAGEAAADGRAVFLDDHATRWFFERTGRRSPAAAAARRGQFDIVVADALRRPAPAAAPGARAPAP